MILLKIITFPVRLMVFLVTAIISGILLAINHTIGMLIIIAAVIIRAVGIFMLILGSANMIITYVTSESFQADIPLNEFLIFMALILAVIIVLYFLPTISEKMFVWIDIGALWLWGLAKTVLFCRNCF